MLGIFQGRVQTVSKRPDAYTWKIYVHGFVKYDMLLTNECEIKHSDFYIKPKN